MKMRNSIAVVLACLIPGLAEAGILCVDAGGYYGFIHVVEKPEGVTIDARQAYAYQISRELGFAPEAEASEILVSLSTGCVTSGGLLRCQGQAIVSYRTFRNVFGKFDAVVDLAISKQAEGHNVTLEITVPSMGKTGQASHEFHPSLGECKGSL